MKLFLKSFIFYFFIITMTTQAAKFQAESALSLLGINDYSDIQSNDGNYIYLPESVTDSTAYFLKVQLNHGETIKKFQVWAIANHASKGLIALLGYQNIETGAVSFIANQYPDNSTTILNTGADIAKTNFTLNESHTVNSKKYSYFLTLVFPNGGAGENLGFIGARVKTSKNNEKKFYAITSADLEKYPNDFENYLRSDNGEQLYVATSAPSDSFSVVPISLKNGEILKKIVFWAKSSDASSGIYLTLIAKNIKTGDIQEVIGSTDPGGSPSDSFVNTGSEIVKNKIKASNHTVNTKKYAYYCLVHFTGPGVDNQVIFYGAKIKTDQNNYPVSSINFIGGNNRENVSKPSGGAYLYVPSSVTEESQAVALLTLKQGQTVKSASAFFKANDPSKSIATFLAYQNIKTGIISTLGDTSTISNQGSEIEKFPIAITDSSHVINLKKYNYFLVTSWPAGADEEVNFYGAKIKTNS